MNFHHACVNIVFLRVLAEAPPEALALHSLG